MEVLLRVTWTKLIRSAFLCDHFVSIGVLGVTEIAGSILSLGATDKIFTQ